MSKKRPTPPPNETFPPAKDPTPTGAGGLSLRDTIRTVLMVLIGLLISLGLQRCAQNETRRHRGELIALIDMPEGWGSATPVASPVEGVTAFLTARHVAENIVTDGTTTVRVGEMQGRAVRVALHHDPEIDVAIVWVQGDTFELVDIDYREVRIGDRGIAVGWVYGRLRTMCEGLVSEPNTLSADIMPGCSGGAVLIENRIVGVAVANVATQVGPGLRIPVGVLTVFVPISEISDWLRDTLR